MPAWNKMVPPEKCFQLYMAVKAHFTTESYDAVKYNARIRNATPDVLQQRHDKVLFQRVGKMFDSSKEVATFFVANMTYGNLYPLGDIDKSELLYKKWQKNRQSLTKIFKDDVHYLQEHNLLYNQLVDGRDVPQLFLLYKNGKINIETLCIMNEIDGFVDTWKKKYPLFKDEFLRIKKLGSFIKFDKDKFQAIHDELKNA